MWKKILIGVGVLIALLLAVVAFQPSTFHIERSTAISSPPDRVFALVNDSRSWREWSPWEKLDPGMQRSYSGAPSGLGAKYAWVGNDEVGEGRMTIEQSEPFSRIAIKIEFLKPFEATNTATFGFTASGHTVQNLADPG